MWELVHILKMTNLKQLVEAIALSPPVLRPKFCDGGKVHQCDAMLRELSVGKLSSKKSFLQIFHEVKGYSDPTDSLLSSIQLEGAKWIFSL